MNAIKPTVVSTVTISLDALNRLSHDHAGNMDETPESLADFMLSGDKVANMVKHTYFKPGETVVIPDGHRRLGQVEVDGVTIIAVCADDVVLPEVDLDELDMLCKELYLCMSVDDYESDIMDMDGFTKERFATAEMPLTVSASARYGHVNRTFVNEGMVMGCILANMAKSLMVVPDDDLETLVHEDPSVKVSWAGSTPYSVDLNDVRSAISEDIPYLAKLMHLRADIMGNESMLTR